MGVFLAYANAEEASLIDRRLYLPEAWFSDPQRLSRAGVPKALTFMTKGQLAVSMIAQAIANGVRFDFVGGDCAYGYLPWLRDWLTERRIPYLLEISSETQVWLTRPKTAVPKRRKKRGRRPCRRKVVAGEPKPERVSDIAKALSDATWERICVRDGEKHPLEWEFCSLLVVTCRGGLPGKEEWLILRRSISDKTDIKYGFSNAEKSTPQKTHAHRMARRYWVERAIQIGKGGVGMDEYAVRSYQGWHHHMTMTLLSMMFLLRLRVKLALKAPMLTIEDVKEILSVVLPKKAFSPAEVLELIEAKHRARAAAKASHHRRYHAKMTSETARGDPPEKEMD